MTEQPEYTLIDSHAHIHMDPLYEQVDRVVHRAEAENVRGIITVGIEPEDARRALSVAETYPRVFAVLGIHPHNAKEGDDNALATMEELAGRPKVVGYGEIGLDFFRNWSPRDAQLRVFRKQISLAKRLGLPVVIHLRSAYDEGLGILEHEAPFPAGGVIHCFSGDRNDAERALALGFYISIPGTVTYKKNDALRDIVKSLPEGRILLETDCPFLSPEPLRGKDNEPAYMTHTAAKVAQVRNTDLKTIAEVTTRNAVTLFRLPSAEFGLAGV